jgi:HSP20 family protein
MTHVRFNRKPFEGSFNTLVDDLVTELPVLFKNQVQSQWKGFAPVNISELDNSYQLELIAPGFEKSDFKVNLDKQVLTISVEKKQTSDADLANNKKVIRKEYAYRSFKRSFTIDEKIDESGIEAQYVNGVLTLNLPKKENVKQSAKEINIR